MEPIDQLHSHLTRTLTGNAVLVRGAGAARLVRELLAEARGRRMAAISVRCGDAEPLAPIAFLNPALPSDRRFPPGPDGIAEELSRLVLGAAGRRGLCLVVEDLHRADPETSAFLRYLVRRTPGHRVLAVFTAPAGFTWSSPPAVHSEPPAGLAAAEHAERNGLHHAALALYQRLRPQMPVEPQLAGVLLTLRRWEEAREVIDALPDGHRMLRSRLAFGLGDIAGARAHAAGLPARLAELALHTGDLAECRRLAPSPEMIGVTAHLAGDLDTACARLTEALDAVRAEPPARRDLPAEAKLLGHLGDVALARRDLATAARLHTEALRMRRELADARGALHSLHMLGSCRLHDGDRAGAVALFEEADRLAACLDEPLERARITRTRSELALHSGSRENAYRLARDAHAAFTPSPCRYDVTHAQLVRSAAATATGREREGIELMIAARETIRRWGYGLLTLSYPAAGPDRPVAQWIAGALTAYACGEALGLPYRDLGPTGDPDDRIETLRAEPDITPILTAAIDLTENADPMHAIPRGWAFPPGTLHSSENASAACVIAACASWSLEGASPGLLLEIARETAVPRSALAANLDALAAGTWTPPDGGIPANPAQTVTAALSCVLRTQSLRHGILLAVRLGGATDTVAALTATLLATHKTPTEVREALPWSDGVSLPTHTGATTALAQLRTGSR